MEEKKRVVGIDLLRLVALVSVETVHFCVARTQFMVAEFHGPSMYLQSLILFLGPGISLFMMISGFLNCEKRLNRGYYRGLTRVLVAYLFFSLVTIAFRIFYMHEDRSVYDWVMSVLGFEAIPYSWYICMWIGLFLLTPFLNVLWAGLQGRRQHGALVATVSAVTLLPLMTNSEDFTLFPDYWKIAFPLAYYFIGCYIRTYRPRVKRWKLVALIFLLIHVNSIYTYFFTDCRQFTVVTGDYDGLYGAAIGTAIFLLLYDVEIRWGWVRRLLQRAAELSLYMYLSFWMLEEYVYDWFLPRYCQDQAQFGKWMLVVVPTILAAAAILAWVYDGARKHIVSGL